MSASNVASAVYTIQPGTTAMPSVFTGYRDLHLRAVGRYF